MLERSGLIALSKKGQTLRCVRAGSLTVSERIFESRRELSERFLEMGIDYLVLREGTRIVSGFLGTAP